MAPTPQTILPHNFSAGPGALPESVLLEAQQALTREPVTGLSVLGISHRSPWFSDVIDEAEDHFRALMHIPDNYRVLFLQGGGTLQFAQIPMTLLRGRAAPADYLHTGYWSGQAIPDARLEGTVRVVWTGEAERFCRLPAVEEIDLSPEATYLHYVSNETVEGLQFPYVPGYDSVRRVCDMSSDLLSRPVDVTRFSLIYAHAQKNLGPSGVTVVIVCDDILEEIPPSLPSMLDYRRHATARSIYNTPPVFAIYVTMLVARWLRHTIGGVEAMGAINAAKAVRLYDTIDASGGFYRGHAAREHRSSMNVVFTLPTPDLERRCLEQAEAAGFYGLKGHRSMGGGLRASLYNAVSLASVDALADFLCDFQRQAG